MAGMIYLIGDPVEQSLSPVFQNAALQALGVDMIYEAVRIQQGELGGFVDSLRAPGVVGANITVPHKVATAGMMDSLERGASLTGAVNTVVVREGELRGSNTDVDGFLAALREIAPKGPVRPSALVLGAGGAARAVVWALASAGIAREITVWSRDHEKAQLILNMVREGLGRTGGSMPGFASVPSLDAIGPKARERLGLVVNATPLGMGERVEENPLAGFEGLPADTLVFDLTYGPVDSRMLRDAREQGHPTCGGISMLLYQGARSFRLWTEREAPLDVMREAVAGHIESTSHRPGAGER